MNQATTLPSHTTPLIISYRLTDAHGGFVDYLKELIGVAKNIRVCEIGGGANPALPLDYIQARNIEYTVLDISADELAKAPAGYRKIVADITQPGLVQAGGFDIIFSRMLAEHVSNGCDFHTNVGNMLADTGVALHFFPTLYAPPFVINRLLPEKWAQTVLDIFQPNLRHKKGLLAKFPAYYSWCRGPTKKQITRFESIGLEVLAFIGFYGHSGYYRRFPLLLAIHKMIAGFMYRHPTPWFTSFAYVVLRKQQKRSTGDFFRHVDCAEPDAVAVVPDLRSARVIVKSGVEHSPQTE